MEKKTLAAEKDQKVSKYIPDDISISILSKLPLKSLKRFECVGKSWSLLFENRIFMKMFHTKFLSNLHCCSYYDGASLLLKLSEPFEEVLYYLSGEKFGNIARLDGYNPFTNYHNFRLVGFGSINGLLCLHEYDHSGQIVLWNPATQQIKFIPPSQAESIDLYIPDVAKNFFNVSVMYYVHGFGYDHIRKDYKVIRYVCFFRESSGKYPADLEDIISSDWLGEVSLAPLWEIYSLRSNSWRALDVDMPSSSESPFDIDRPSFSDYGTQVYMDGVCHWLCKGDEEDSPVGPCLVSFYLSNEVFFVTPIPSDLDDCFDIEALWINLAVLNEFIALFSYHEDTTTFHISVLGEFGMKESWTKLFIFGPFPCVERPIGVGTKGEIFFKRKDEELAWFDLRTQMIEELCFNAGNRFGRIIIYKETFFQFEEQVINYYSCFHQEGWW